MAKVYDRTVAELMADAAAELEHPAARGDVVAWFAERYPLVRASTVRASVVGLTENDNTRHHYASLAKRPPLFVREPDGTLLRYDAEGGAELEAADGEPQESASLKFALEASRSVLAR
jgi:hypothetical protein